MSEDAVTPTLVPLPERPVEPPNINLATGKPVDAAEPVSPRLSFQGWALGVWLVKNKGYVKAVLAPCSAILTVGANIDAQALKFALGLFGIGLVTISFKFGYDAFDYFVNEVPMRDVREPRT